MKTMLIAVIAASILAALAGCAAPTPNDFPPRPTIVPGGPSTPTAPVTPTAASQPTPASATPTPLGPATPGRLAPVSSVEIVMRESLPVQISALVRGELPDSCTKIGEMQQAREGSTIMVRITTTRPPDAMCAMVMVPYQQAVAINALGLPKGKYLVVVNGVRAEFTLAVDNIVSSLPTPGVPPTRISWAEAEALVLSGQVVGGFQTHALEVTLNLRDGRTVVTTEPRIDLIFEVVKRCGAKCANLTLATE